MAIPCDPSIPWDDIAPEVISHIDPWDTPTLFACSLTHTSWRLPAQRRLYHTVEIRSREDIRRWYEFDAKEKFTHYVRHLVYSGDEGNPLGPRDLSEMFGEQFLGFKEIHTLEIRHLTLGWFDLDLFRLAFGHLRKTLRALLIRDATVTLNKLLELLTLFPRLHCLGLDRFTVVREPFQILGELPFFRGTLNLSGPVDGYGLRFIEDLTRMLPNFPSVLLRLNLSYHATRHLLKIPSFPNHITTMLLGYQDGVPESIDLSRCRNLRMLSIRTQGYCEEIETSLVAKGKFFRLMETIASRELEYIVIEASPGLSLMQYSAWGHFFKLSSALQVSCGRLSIVIDPLEKFMTETFTKGGVLARFLGCGNDYKRTFGHCIDITY